MKSNYLKHIFSAALVAAVSLGNVSCINDLDISSINPQSSSSFDQEGAFVKQYALLGLTGQKGLAGTPDLDGQDEGESGFYRTISIARNCLRTNVCGYGRTTWIFPNLRVLNGIPPASVRNGYMCAWDMTLPR